MVASSRSGVPIRLTDERWRHVVARHPEMDGQLEMVIETLSDPDMIQQGDRGELLAVRFFERTPLTRKHLVVAYREIDGVDGFVLTAYFTRRPSAQRVTLWKR
jgi:hypothetical protein